MAVIEGRLSETITAVATPPGKGGVGVVRIAGPHAYNIAQHITRNSQQFRPRYAHFQSFYDCEDQLVDQGLLLYFPNPHSFTGDDIIELQAHGGPVILDNLVQAVVAQGARLARPGEFSQRAFLNNKIDLAQAEAIADLIDASSKQAAQSAQRSLTGAFSKTIYELVEQLVSLRTYIEAAIDFPDDDVDFLSEGNVYQRLYSIQDQLDKVKQSAQQGRLLREGMTLVIAGEPNAGKSSLMNALSGSETAIVTEMAGTTRDVLKEHIHIDGMPLHIVDTAGLHDSDNLVEQEGIRRAQQVIDEADLVLLVVDATKEQPMAQLLQELNLTHLNQAQHVTVVDNKIDLNHQKPGMQSLDAFPYNRIQLSAKQGTGIDHLREHLRQTMGLTQHTEGTFMARQRHLIALEQAERYLLEGQHQLEQFQAGECLAEELRQAQFALNEITGEFSHEDLLDRIFSSFCIGK